MGAHSTPRGETSTAKANGLKGSAGQYTGKHRAGESAAGHQVGSPERNAKIAKILKGSNYERGN